MDGDRIWRFEEALWLGDADACHGPIDDECVMVLPTAPHVFDVDATIEAVAAIPRWSTVVFDEQRVQRPDGGLIVIAYRAQAEREGKADDACCTTTIRRRGHEDRLVMQHSQLPPLTLR